MKEGGKEGRNECMNEVHPALYTASRHTSLDFARKGPHFFYFI